MPPAREARARRAKEAGRSALRAISVIGPGECSPEEAERAEEVGRLLARNGFAVVCGGLGGVMAAACKGACEAGGLTIGILPGGSSAEANPYVKVAIPTGLGEARNTLVVRSGEAVIAIGGAYGTLSEIGCALKIGKRVIGLDTWPIGRGIELAASPEQAVRMATGL